MGRHKTLEIQTGDDLTDPSAESKMDPLKVANTPVSKFNTILSETTFVTEDKIRFNKEEIQKFVDLDKYYELKEKFAEGGQGIISVGKDKILNRYIAIKSLKSDYLNNDQILESFITEAKITAQLDHPSIIPLYSINTSNVDEGLHLSMKLIHGQNLKELIEGNAFLLNQYRKSTIIKLENSILSEMIEDFLKVCDAISFAHNKKVIHNDLKPDNIMIGEYHEVYVMDWGIASLYNENDNLVSEEKINKISGTPGYISPEILTGGKATPASDQYALGMILFEIITMKPGITGNSIKEVFEKTRDAQLESFNHRLKECRISKDLIAVVKKATAINPRERYPSVTEMADDVRRFLQNEELSARPDNIPRKIFRIIFKHKNLAATIILLLLLLFSGIAIFGLIKQNKAERESKIRSLKMVRIHSDIENNAHIIDRHLFHISHLLSRFASTINEVLTRNDLCNKKTFYPTSQFKDKNNLPEGSVFSPVYKRYISLDSFNYSLAPGLKYSEVEKRLMKICTIKKYLIRYLVNSDADDLVFENIVKGMDRAVKEGFPIKWIYIAFYDGLMVNYPGSSGLSEGYDPRERTWYLSAKNKHRQVWSKPYIDIAGLGVVISASKSLYDESGSFLGVVGFDMTFDYITDTSMCRKCNNKSVMTRYLIDSQGNVILYNHLNKKQIKEAEKDYSHIKFKPFPYPQIKSHIKEKKSDQFEVISNGKTILVGYAPVKTLGWYYVETVNLDQYMDQ